MLHPLQRLLQLAAQLLQGGAEASMWQATRAPPQKVRIRVDECLEPSGVRSPVRLLSRRMPTLHNLPQVGQSALQLWLLPLRPAAESQLN